MAAGRVTSTAKQSVASSRDRRRGSDVVRDGLVADLWDALLDVLDPEIPVSVVDLGLVCDIRRDGRQVEVDVTFTSTACPAIDLICEEIRDRLLQEPGVDQVVVNETWRVTWTAARISAEGRAQMRRYGITV